MGSIVNSILCLAHRVDAVDTVECAYSEYSEYREWYSKWYPKSNSPRRCCRYCWKGG